MSAVTNLADYRQQRQQSEQPEKRMQDGFVAIPNAIIRAAKGRLKGLHLLALIAVIEKTIGFQKDKDEISDSQIAKEWDCDRERVGEAIAEMIEAGILNLHGKGRYGRILSIANPENWREITCGKKPQQVRQKAALGAAKSRNENGKKPHSTDNYQQTVNTPLPPNGEVADATAGQNQKSGSAKPAVPYAAILQAYREALPELAQPDLLTDARKKTIAARWKQVLNTVDPLGRVRYSGVDDGVIWWSRLFAKVRMNPHWMGNNDRAWAASFDWIMGPQNFLKVLEWRPVEVQP